MKLTLFFLVLFLQSSFAYTCDNINEYCPSVPSYFSCQTSYKDVKSKIIVDFELDIFFDEANLSDEPKDLVYFASLRTKTVGFNEDGKKDPEIVTFGVKKKNIKVSTTKNKTTFSGVFYYFIDDDENYFSVMDYFGENAGISFELHGHLDEDEDIEKVSGKITIDISTDEDRLPPNYEHNPKTKTLPMNCTYIF